MISGTEYYRRKARLSLRTLSKRTGIAGPLLRKCNVIGKEEKCHAPKIDISSNHLFALTV